MSSGKPMSGQGERDKGMADKKMGDPPMTGPAMPDKAMMSKEDEAMASEKPQSGQMTDKGMAAAGEEETISAMTESRAKQRTYTIPDDATLRKTL